MNNNNSVFKIICAVLFLAFALVSCWATLQSLALSLP